MQVLTSIYLQLFNQNEVGYFRCSFWLRSCIHPIRPCWWLVEENIFVDKNRKKLKKNSMFKEMFDKQFHNISYKIS